LCGLGAGTSAAVAQTAVVVKSSAKAFPVGSKVDDEDTITLASGDSVTVLTKKGTRTMKGPGTFRVGDTPKSNRARFANLTRKRAASKAGTGAVRNAATDIDRPLSPNLYYVDVARSGTVCLYDMEAVRLWRPYNEGIATYKVMAEGSDTPTLVTFDDGESVAPLDPALLSVAQGPSYIIAGPDEEAEPATITFAALRQEYRDANALAAALVENGCMVQLELMGDKLGG